MKLTAKARTAVTAMVDLAAQNGAEPECLAHIAERQGLSVSFLEQIFAKLRRAGLVESQRGAGGGYVLAKPAVDITPAMIVRAIDVEIRSTACIPGSDMGCRGLNKRCLTHNLWAKLDHHIETFLDGVTLAELAGLGAVPHSDTAMQVGHG